MSGRSLAERITQREGPEDATTLTDANNPGMLQMKMGDPSAALPILWECREGLNTTLPLDHRMLGASTGYTTECHLAQAMADHYAKVGDTAKAAEWRAKATAK